MNLDQAGPKLLALEANKKQSKHAHINFGKALCPDAYDGKDASGFRTWRIKVANYLSNDDDMVEELLDCGGMHKEQITKNEFDAKAADEGWDDNQENAKFSKVMYRFLLAKTCENANRLVQNGNHLETVWTLGEGSFFNAIQLGVDVPVPLEDDFEHPTGQGCERGCLQHSEARGVHQEVRKEPGSRTG